MNENTLKIHMKLKASGNLAKITFFNEMMKSLDTDWPYHQVVQARMPECTVCGGRVWRMPRLRIEEIKKLIRQVNETKLLPGNLKVKIKQFRSEKACQGEGQ